MRWLLYMNAFLMVGCHGVHSITTGYPSEALMSLAFMCFLLMSFIFPEYECQRCHSERREESVLCDRCAGEYRS